MAFFGLLGGEAAASDAAIEAAALRSDRFRQEREGDWKRLEAIVTRMEAGRWRRLSDEDVLALPVLYRTVASSLSVARETSLDAATLAYLEALVQRAWFLVYGPRTTLAGWLARFLGGEWSRAVRAIWPELLVAFAVMAAGRLLFGIGAETMIVATIVALGIWFAGRQLAFAMALSIAATIRGPGSALDAGVYLTLALARRWPTRSTSAWERDDSSRSSE